MTSSPAALPLLAALAARRRQPQPILATFCQFRDADLIEALARTALDGVVLDMQHGMFDTAAVAAAVGTAALAGTPAFVRVPVNAGGLTSRVLDFGAAGVICPMVNSAEDARQLVALTRFPPVGARSWGPRRALALTAADNDAYLATANDRTLVLAMVETRAALDDLDAILAVPGLDGVFVGPNDLAVSLTGGAGLRSPDVAAALDHVAVRAQATGRLAGVFAGDIATAQAMIDRGYGFIGLMHDATFVTQGANAAVAAIRAARPDAANRPD